MFLPLTEVLRRGRTRLDSRMKKCHLDIETYSEAPLKKTGLFRYAEDPSTEILCTCYSFDDEAVNLWIPDYDLPEELIEQIAERMTEHGELHIGPECPEDLMAHAKAGGQFRAHNAQFERTLLNSHAGKNIGFPHTRIHQWVCTAAKVSAHGLQRALGDAAKSLGTYPKSEDGKAGMMQLAKPRSGKEKRWTPHNSPDRFKDLYLYCIDDVKAERDIDHTVPDLSPYEQKVWQLDQKINDRGFKIDKQGVLNVSFLISLYKAEIEKKFRRITGQFIKAAEIFDESDEELMDLYEKRGINPTQTGAFADWIREQGYDIPDLQAPTVAEAVKDKNMPAHVKQALILRSIHASKAVAKYPAILRAVMEDDRIRGMFMYYGAGTGRWSSMIVQLQNMYRGAIEDPDFAIDAYNLRDLDWIKWLYKEEPMKIFASTVRGMFISDEGKDLIAFDFNQIEARVIAWLAGQKDTVEAFRRNIEIYEYTAAKIYGIPIEQVTKEQRFIGKIAVLALGYQGGQAAFAKMAKAYGVDIDPEFAEKIKNDWREANPKIKSLWYDLEGAARSAVNNPGVVYSIPNKKVMFKMEGRWLYMRLPSGRRIAYYQPKIDPDTNQVTYMGIDTYTRRWMRVTTYGGKLAENAVQAIARDLLVNSMFALEARGYDIIGTIHDEIVMEVLESFGTLEEVKRIMCTLPMWADGLPVNAGGWRRKRYKK